MAGKAKVSSGVKHARDIDAGYFDLEDLDEEDSARRSKKRFDSKHEGKRDANAPQPTFEGYSEW